MMLRPMTKEAYQRFTALAMRDYAESKAKAERLSAREGEGIAEAAWASLLPEHQKTRHHHFFTAFEGEVEVGMIWFKEELDWETPYAYLYQVWIWDEHQGRGLGRQLMRALENELAVRGLRRLRLHVFAFNQRALKLYESMGFEITNLVMVKEL